MKRNGKYFVAPQQSTDNFKVLFSRLAAEGAGRPVDSKGFADGPWTPETLTQAICELPGNEQGIERRTVEVWFQANDNGIGTNNIRWLARIFGCDDPEETSKWAAEIRASKDRLTAERRAKQKETTTSPTMELAPPTIDYDVTLEDGFTPGYSFPQHEVNADEVETITGINFALRCERMFSGPNKLIMPIAIWGGLAVLWFLAIILGVHSVTYEPTTGINKQIGFIWSPGWNVGEPIFLPILLILCASMINMWRGSDRNLLLEHGAITGIASWRSKVRSFTSSFWAIFLICYVLIFLLQWAGVYLLPLLENNQDVPMIDWMLIALVRPDILSTDEAIFVSFLGFLYSGMIYWFLFTSSLFLFIVSGDYAAICAAKDDKHVPIYSGHSFKSGLGIMQTVYRCTILGIMVALCIKVNAAYLVTDAENISSWLLNDTLLFLGYAVAEWQWINGSPSPFFTSFLLLFLLCFVFGACLVQVKSGIDKTILFAQEESRAMRTWIRMSVVIGILSIGYIAIGQFYGFSLFLGLSVLIALSSLLWRFEPAKNVPEGKGP